jgi:L-ascorbate metabolism protein UlaG (beta-lactamase superfamily)
MGIVLGVLLVAAIGWALVWRNGAMRAREREGRYSGSQRWREGRFRNVATTRKGNIVDVTKLFWLARGIRRIPRETLPVAQVRREVLDGPASQALRVTWLGHSTTLIEIDGLRLLTDPVLSERASPFSFAGPKRFTPPALSIDQLPPLDAVVLSHDHFDHLDHATVLALAERVPRFYTTLGVGQRLIGWGIDAGKIVELDWWQEAKLGALTLAATPAQHFSGRSLNDGNSTLWASWVVLGSRERLFFSGDTGMHQGFAEIGERYGPFDLTMIECGAYNEAWPDVHMLPEQSVAAHRMVRGMTMMPVHWGTFDLALHRWDEPAERARALAAEQGIRLVQPRPGETVSPDSPLQAPWWRSFEKDPLPQPSIKSSQSAT